PHVPQRRARLQGAQGGDGGARRRVPAPVPRTTRGGTRRPGRARATAGSGRRACARDRGAEPAKGKRGDGAVSHTEARPSSNPAAGLPAGGPLSPSAGPFSLDLEVFEGPFDLLVTLILNEEVDLLEVHLAGSVLA